MEPLDKRTLGEIADELDSQDIPPWEVLPDLELYMDQVITLFGQRFEPLAVGNDRPLTSSMINNYVKAGLIEKPSGKKYSREALAQLLMIVQLKKTTPMEYVKSLLHPDDGTTTGELYHQFRQYQEQVVSEFKKQEDAPGMMYALKSSSFQFIMQLSGE